MPGILIIDDDKQFCTLQQKILNKNGRDCAIAHTGNEGAEYIRKNTPGIVLLDIRLHDISGVDLLKKIKTMNPLIEVIMITGISDTKTAIECIRMGALEYMPKPVRSEELLITIEKAEQTYRMYQELDSLRHHEAPEIIGLSKETETVKKLILKAGESDVTILITGETGTGKEVVARHIHNCSSRRKSPFVPVNCAAISDSLMESEFFGFEKGTFTGANQTQKGYFERANTGTIFLDEIGDMPQKMQTALLRLLEDKKVVRIGGKQIDLDIRVLCATNRDLEKAVRDGDFRQDLFYRINVLEIKIPPLRERKEDILPITEHFIATTCLGKSIPVISKKGEELLLQYSWPGNIRELRNIVERELILASENSLDFSQIRQYNSRIHEEDNLFKISVPYKSEISFQRLEKAILEKALQMNSGNVTQTATFLKMQRSSLRSKMSRHNL